ncbi:hypothetical protein LCGC14_0358470 [marine sediment metagenome]|uniref:Right handed beta helix domain-containing protein n=1 Tax=marine sediment metagenome TaxID=412755 RepID=A0A0F9TRJ6_9ZZZZ
MGSDRKEDTDSMNKWMMTMVCFLLLFVLTGAIDDEFFPGKVTITTTSQQLELAYDASNQADFTVDSSGNLTVAPSGDWIGAPAGSVKLQPSGDTDDYLDFFTSGNVPAIKIIGGPSFRIESDDGVEVGFFIAEDSSNYVKVFWRKDANTGNISSKGALNLISNDDTNDYIQFSTTTDVPQIGTVGGCDLKITADSGEIDFDNENLTTTGNLFADGGAFTSVFKGIFPFDPNHLATKEYVDLAVGSSFDLFLSDTDDGVVADTHVMFPLETGEAESTESNPTPLNAGVDDQLALSWLSEAGVPGTLDLRTGVYDCHIHLNKNAGGAPTDVYWTLSFVDADGSSNKTLVVTSEIQERITNSAESYDIHAVVRDEVLTGVTKRLLFELYGNISNGQNVTITATLEGSTDAHITFMLPSSVWQNHGDQLDNINAGDTVTLSGDTVLNGDVHFDGATAGRDVDWDRTNNQMHFENNASLAFGVEGSGRGAKFLYDGDSLEMTTFNATSEDNDWNIGDSDYGFDIYWRTTVNGDYVLFDYTNKRVVFVDVTLEMGNDEISGSNFDINGGTVDGITSLTTNGTVVIGSGGDDDFSIVSSGIDIDTSGNISNAGTIGIGTASPGEDLEIQSSSPVLRLRDTGATASATAAFIEFGGTDAGVWSRTCYAGDGSSGNTDMYIQAEISDLHLGDSSGNSVMNLQGGNVGIGLTTVDANYKLIIRRAADINLGIGLQSSELALAAFNDALSANIPMRFYASEYNLLNGNVGINTTTPASKLSINGGLHVGGDSDAGDNNLLVDGTITTANLTATGTVTVKTGGTATLFVAASDATAAEITRADYTSDGTNDTEIQEAIDALTVGTVELSTGSFNLETGLVMEGTVNVKGQGMDVTFIKWSNALGANTKMISWAAADGHNTLSRLTVSGEDVAVSTYTFAGLHLNDPCKVIIEYVKIANFDGTDNSERNGQDGIFCTGTPEHCTIRHCEIVNIDDDGADINNAIDLLFTANRIHDCGDNGMDNDAARRNIYTHNIVWDTGGHGLELENASNYCVMTDNILYDIGDGTRTDTDIAAIYIADENAPFTTPSHYNVVTNNIIIGVDAHATKNAYGIYIGEECELNNVSNNFVSNTEAEGIKDDSLEVNNTILGNLYDSAAVDSSAFGRLFNSIVIAVEGVPAFFDRYKDTTSAPSGIKIRKARGDFGAGTIVTNGGAIGRVWFVGWDGTAWADAASIRVLVDGDPGADDMPGMIEFWTSPDGSDTEVKQMAIRADGTIEVTQYIANTRQSLQWADTIAASADGFARMETGSVLQTIRFAADVGFTAIRDGCILGQGVSLTFTTETNLDTLEIEIFEDDVDMGATLTFTGDGTPSREVEITDPPFAHGTYEFDKGDILSVNYDETGVLVWDNIIGTIEIHYHD